MQDLLKLATQITPKETLFGGYLPQAPTPPGHAQDRPADFSAAFSFANCLPSSAAPPSATAWNASAAESAAVSSAFFLSNYAKTWYM